MFWFLFGLVWFDLLLSLSFFVFLFCCKRWFAFLIFRCVFLDTPFLLCAIKQWLFRLLAARYLFSILANLFRPQRSPSPSLNHRHRHHTSSSSSSLSSLYSSSYVIFVIVTISHTSSRRRTRAHTMACTHTNVIYVHTQACTQATHVAHTRTYTHRHMHPHTKHAYTNTDPEMSDWLVFMYYHRNLLQASKKTTRQTARPARATTRPRRRKESSPKEKRCSKRSRKDKTTPKETVLLKDSMTRVCVQYRSARKLVSRLVFPH